MHLLATALAPVVLCAAILNAAVAAEGASPLFTPDQVKVEAMAAKLVASPEMKKGRADLLKRFGADPSAASPDGRNTLDSAVGELANAAALGAANGDPARPMVIWTISEPIKWGKYVKPGARWAVDNPDNIYRFFPVSGAYRYEVTVRPRGPWPTQFSFMLWDTFYGEDTKQNGFLDSPIAGLKDVDVKAEADGSFKFTIDSDPANGRANHIRSNADARVIFIRETQADWTRQKPFDITVKRVDAAPAPLPASFAQMSTRATYLLKNVGNTVAFFKTALANPQPNQMSKPWLRGGGWGFNVNGQFKLADDEALLINVNRKDAKFLAIVVNDPWLRTRENARANGSLNNTQAEADADGSYTYVVSASDPGVRNWADTEGLHEGLVLIRWQALPPDLASADDAVRSTRVIKIADVLQLLPTATRVTPQLRQQQYAARAQAYANRYLP
jgi:hypothetical protein